ncbi:MAG: apolipoprotein N-acyltransferase [Planctomycetes bacterium]|nr:apolipoprotein N-acyltransferase [Planctomycetota bacterium]
MIEKLAHYLYGTGYFRYLLTAVSGILLVISFPPLAYGLFGWIALVPLLIAVFSAPNIRKATDCGAVTGLVFYTVSLSFFLDIFGIFGIAIANILSIYIALFAASCWFAADNLGLGRSFVFVPIFWTAIEFFRSELYYLKFAWLGLGYSMAPMNILIQVCDIAGVYGLTFIIVTVNALLAWAALEGIRRRVFVWRHIILGGLIIVLLILYGSTKEPYIPKYRDAKRADGIPVVVVQEMVGNLDTYIKMTYSALGGPGPSKKETLVVWPEVAVDEILSTPNKLRLIEALVKDKNIYLVTGDVEPTEDVVRFHNLALIFSPEGELVGKYAKRVPVQFVETIVIPGKRSGVFDTKLGTIGLLICYEIGFSNLSRPLVRRGAQLIVAPTLELGGWGGLSHRHHASMVPFRAVETRKPVIRSAALGISMVVHPSGKVQAQLDHLASGIIKTEVYKSDAVTFYVKYGYLFPRLNLLIYMLCIVLAAGIIVINRFRRPFGS